MMVAMLLVGGCERKQEVPRAVAIREDGVLELKVMSFNVRYENDGDGGDYAWRRRVVPIVAAIREQGVDVMGIQEGLHGQVADLRASLPDYEFSGLGRSDGKRTGEYVGLFFRKDRFEKDEMKSGMIWLSATPDVPGSKTWGNQIPRIANWLRLTDRESGRAFWVVNMHLDHRSQVSKEKGVRLMAEKLVEMNPRREPVVWTGDFNATDGNEVIRFLQGKRSTISPVDGFGGLVETYDRIHPGVAERGTVNFWRNDPKLQWKLDYIFVSKDAKVLEAEVLRDKRPYLSDHFPVVARVRF